MIVLGRLAVTLALVAATLGLRPAAADVGPYWGGPTDYFTTSDGTKIALSVVYPNGFDPSRTYPTILEIAGYENGSANADGRTMTGQTRDFLCTQSGQDPAACTYPDPPLSGDSQAGTSAFRYRDDYVVVHASLRGTGCSSGEFDLFSSRSAQDGYELIEDWIVRQSWSNQEVGLLGHSYSGLTAFLVAAQEGLAAAEGRPHHLVAMTVSGLIDDVYRGITYPGGVFNGLFPPLWTLGVRPAYDVLGGIGQGIVRNADNERGAECAANVATRRRTVTNDPVLQGIADTDNDWWRARSLESWAHLIDVPIHITGAFQDEQTGARGFTHLWEAIPDGVAKRLVISNGNHGTQVDAYETWADRKAWMDHWMRGVGPDPAWGWTNPDASIKPVSVRTLFELYRTEDGDLVSNGHLDSTSFPVEGTRFTEYSLCGDALTTGACEGGTGVYVSGTKRQAWSYQAGYGFGPPVTTADGPDQLVFRGPVVEPGGTWAIDGPITADLRLATTANDTQLYVQLADEDTTTGTVSYLQRGLLKASHRAIDVNRSDTTDVDPTHPDFLYRPYRPHTNPVDVTPLAFEDYLVEVWPVAHVFRPGHRPVLIVTSPPAVDSYYAYTPREAPIGINQLAYGASRVTLPVVPIADIDSRGATGPGCPAYWQVRCV